MPEKDPFALVDRALYNAAPQMSVEEIRQKLASIAMATEALREAQKVDPDLAEKKAAAAEAGKRYSDKLKDFASKLSVLRRLIGLNIVGVPNEVLKDVMGQLSLDVETVRDEQENDDILAQAKEAVTFANEQYSDGFKANRQTVRYLKQILEDKGKA